MKPAEIVSNLGIISYILEGCNDTNGLNQRLLETIRTCQLMAMRLTMDELENIRSESEEIS